MATEEFMNRSLQHAFDAEEVMAYLDGELEPKRAAALAGHLEHCAECQSLAKELRLVSGRMLNFEIEPAPASLGTAVLIENAAHKPGMTKAAGSGWSGASRWRELIATRKVWAFGAAFAMVLVVAGIASISELRRSRTAANPTVVSEPLTSAQPASPERAAASTYKSWLSDESKSQREEQSSLSMALALPAASPPSESGQLAAPESVGPMVVQTASLSIVAKNYDEANAAVQRLVTAHGGYIEKLDAKAQSGDSRSLSVALRVPAKELEGLLVDLRKLGHVEEESKSNEEVSAEYVDLQARLKVAQATERRLVELLGARTGRLEDVLDVERELARVRAEVESMQGQSALMLHRVSYATVQVELSEEYHQKLQSQSSMGTKLRNALLAGVQNLLDGIVALLIFVLNYGLSILFWLALFMTPVWLIWRRLRARQLAKSGSSFQTT
jgi:anti-sigma factor RsiW